MNESDAKLNYLKEKILDSSRLSYIFSDPIKTTEVQLIDFILKINPLRDKISDADSIENLNSAMLDVKKVMLESWDNVWQEKGLSHDAISNFYLESGFNSPEKWIDEQVKIYENKKVINFFEKTSNALKNFFGIDEVENKKDETLSNETINIGREIIKKFNLSHINLSSYSTNKECLSFLNKFDAEASLAFEKLGVLPEVLGINQVISISSNTDGQAFCSSGDKLISLDIQYISSSTILHEWVHALDNYVCQTATSINSHVSSREEVFFEDEKWPITEAYREIRNLTQSLFHDNPEAINRVKTTVIKENSAKFYSIILGNEWYTMTEDKRNYLLTDKSINKINNFMSMNSDSSGYAYTKEDLVSQIKSGGIEFDDKILVTKRAEIESEIKPYFQAVSKNFIYNKSLYYIGCLISNKICAIPDLYLTSKFDTVKQWLGIEDESVKTNYGKEYFSAPCEMLARYFESQVFPKVAKTYNLLSFSPVYKITKDENFENSKDKIVGFVFGKDKILKNISQMRKTENSDKNQMKI